MLGIREILAFPEERDGDDEDSLQYIGDGIVDGTNHAQDLERKQRLEKVATSIHEDK